MPVAFQLATLTGENPSRAIAAELTSHGYIAPLSERLAALNLGFPNGGRWSFPLAGILVDVRVTELGIDRWQVAIERGEPVRPDFVSRRGPSPEEERVAAAAAHDLAAQLHPVLRAIDADVTWISRPT